MDCPKLPDRYIESIADTITRPLCDGVTEEDVFQRIAEAVHQYWIDYGNNESPWKTLNPRLWFTPWRKRGRIRQQAMHQYLKSLVLIYHDATGHWLGRHNVIVPDESIRGDHQEERPVPFIIESMAVIHKTYQPRILEEVLNELKGPRSKKSPETAQR